MYLMGIIQTQYKLCTYDLNFLLKNSDFCRDECHSLFSIKWICVIVMTTTTKYDSIIFCIIVFSVPHNRFK